MISKEDPENTIYYTATSKININLTDGGFGSATIKDHSYDNKLKAGKIILKTENNDISIKANTINNNTSLTSITFYNNKQVMLQTKALSGCSNLEQISLLGDAEFLYYQDSFNGCSKFNTINVKNTLVLSDFHKQGYTAVDPWPNYRNILINGSSIDTLVLPENSNQAGHYGGYTSYLLSKCSNINRVSILGNGILTGFCQDCINLSEVFLLNIDLTLIGDKSFYGCNNLHSIYCYSKEVPTLGWNAFYGCHEDLTIYVPAESLDLYKAADGWSAYAEKIEAHNF